MINCWNGVENVYPSEYVFKSPLELVDRLNDWAELSESEKKHASEVAVGYAEAYDKDVLAPEAVEFIEGVLSSKSV